MRKVFVRNLSFETTDDTLRSTFSVYGAVNEAVVILNKGTNKSKGFGFVTFEDADAAAAACAQPIVDIDGRQAYVNLAAKRGSGPEPESKFSPAHSGTQGQVTRATLPGTGLGLGVGTGGPSSGLVAGDTTLTKLFVRQLAYSTTSEALHREFARYGPIKEAVVLENKALGTSKGFGFVVFEDPASAQAALMEPTRQIDGRTVYVKLAAEPVPGITTGGAITRGKVLNLIKLPTPILRCTECYPIWACPTWGT